MLFLTRHIGDSVMIDNEIFITVRDFKNGQVKLGFDAPKEVIIVRKELWDKEQYEKGVLVQPGAAHSYKGHWH